MRSKKYGFMAIAIFMSFAFAASLVFAETGPSKDWSEKQLQDFVKKPWSKEDLAKMGNPPRYIIKKEIEPFNPNPKTPEELYRNGQRQHRAWILQYGIGISSKDFYKYWIEQEGYKDTKVKLLDLRQESEFAQARIPGAVRVDTGLAYWQLPGKAPDPTMTYYLMCKGGDPANGGSRGAIVKKFMLDMGYTGKIVNITDGFRGWIENGFPVVNDHGLFMLVPGTFQIPEKDSFVKVKEVGRDTSTASLGLAQKFGLKDW